jgi:hypothetical protein
MSYVLKLLRQFNPIPFEEGIWKSLNLILFRKSVVVRDLRCARWLLDAVWVFEAVEWSFTVLYVYILGCGCARHVLWDDTCLWEDAVSTRSFYVTPYSLVLEVQFFYSLCTAACSFTLMECCWLSRSATVGLVLALRGFYMYFRVIFTLDMSFKRPSNSTYTVWEVKEKYRSREAWTKTYVETYWRRDMWIMKWKITHWASKVCKICEGGGPKSHNSATRGCWSTLRSNHNFLLKELGKCME